MKNCYLVTLHYHDGSHYDAYAWDEPYVVFESEEDATDFCEANSDTEHYRIIKSRTITFGDCSPIVINFDSEYDPEDEYAESYWFTIEEIYVVDKKGE